MLDTQGAAPGHQPPPLPPTRPTRVRRNRAEMTVLHSRDWPGPRDFPPPEPGSDEVEAHGKWKADKLRFDMNVCAATAYNDDRKTEAEVNAVLFKRFGKRMALGSVWKLVQRCNTFNPQTKRVHGFWACIPRYRPTRLREFDTVHSRNPQHQLSQLFRQFPHIEAKLITFIADRTTGKKEMRPVSVMDPSMVWDVFLGLCKAEGMNLAPKRWPFTHQKKGYEAIRRWYHEEKYRNPSAAAFNELNESTAKAIRAAYRSIGVPKVAPRLGMAYTRTELDEHMFDAEFTVFVPGETPDEWIAVPQGRLYFLVIVECESQAVLAADVAFGDAFDRNDVKALVHDAILPPPRPDNFRLDDDDWALAEDACFPAELPEFQRCTWQVLAMDRALQHRAGDARDAIQKVTGCQVDFDTPDEALSRHFIEGFFKRLAAYARWLESATGNNPDSPSRRDSAGGAVRSRLTRALARELLQLYCRNYNVTKKKGTGRSPNQVLLDRRAQDRCYIGRLVEQDFDNLYLLLPRMEGKLCERVSRAHGPVCVYLGYEYYLGPDLSSRHELLRAADLTVDVYVQRDARYAIAVPRAYPEFAFLIVLCGPWAAEPHTLEWRMFVKRMAASGWFADHASKPLLGLAAARGLGRAAATDAGLAKLLAGYYTFIDHYGRGEVRYFNLTPEQRAELQRWVGVDESEPLSSAEQRRRPGAAGTSSRGGGGHGPEPAPQAATQDPDDEYGIL